MSLLDLECKLPMVQKDLLASRTKRERKRSVSHAAEPITYQIKTTPTFVINTGRAEVFGSIRITPINNAITLASTVHFTFENTPCDNTFTDDPATGIALRTGGAFTAAGVTVVAVSNNAAGCVVSVAVPAGLAVVNTGADFIELVSVRGRIDLSPAATPGTDINVRLSATPAGSTLFTRPKRARVATSAVALLVSVRAGDLLIGTGPAALPRITVVEGFQGAWVHHMTGPSGIPPPADARFPVAGATNNTQIHMHVAGIPAGALTWPTDVAGRNVSGAGVGGASAGTLRLITPGATTDPIYEYTTVSQAASDLNVEKFVIIPTISGRRLITVPGPALTPAMDLDPGTVEVQLYPPLQPDDATSLTSVPFTTGAAGTKFRPRFNDPLNPSPPGRLFSGLPLETAHTLLLDIVGFSQLPTDRQRLTILELQEVVRATKDFTRRPLYIPTGDGMALVFFVDSEAPARCAVEISRSLRKRCEISVRMGVHTGPVYRVVDMNGNPNVTGDGINVAQRVMGCGDAGHILLSMAYGDILRQVSRWIEYLHNIPEVDVKHGRKVQLVNLYGQDFGNAATPKAERQELAIEQANQSPLGIYVTHLLFPFVTNQDGCDTRLLIANTGRDGWGTVSGAGTVTLSCINAKDPLFSYTFGHLRPGETQTVMASAIVGGFMGYVIASCNFPFAYGIATIVEEGIGKTPTGKAIQGYMAQVIRKPRQPVDAEWVEIKLPSERSSYEDAKQE